MLEGKLLLQLVLHDVAGSILVACIASHRIASHGIARHCLAWHGLAWRGLAWHL